MSTALTVIGPLLEAAILVGLIRRRRLAKAVSLAPLLLALIASASTVALCPSCNTWDFWIVKELTHDALFLLLALELTTRVIDEGPARRAAWRWLAFVFAVTLVLVVSAPGGWIIVELLPRLSVAIAWLYMGLMVVMLRYGVRVEPLHDVILSGFTPYFMLYAVTWSQAAQDTTVANMVNPVMFVFVLVLLLRVAWQKDSHRALPGMRRLYERRRSQPRSTSSSHPMIVAAGLPERRAHVPAAASQPRLRSRTFR